LIAAHPAEVELMRQEHMAGKHELIDGNYLWPVWLESFGKAELWMQFRTPEMVRSWLSWMTPPGSTLKTFAGLQGFICQQVLGEIRFCAAFHNGENCETIWLARCEQSLLSEGEMKVLPGYITEQERLLSKLGQIEPVMAKFAALANQIDNGTSRLAATTSQIEAKTDGLREVIEPLNGLYPEVKLAELRKRAIGKMVPDLFVDWVMMRFNTSNPPRLPTKGEAFDNCGPGTTIGNKLKSAGIGISKQRFADHLTTIRRLLEQDGWLAPRTPGKTRKRATHYQPDDRGEDHNQPTPAESAEDRDDERQATQEE